MTLFRKTIFVEYSADQMYSLINDIEKYPEFLPWCGDSKVLSSSDKEITAFLQIDFYGVKQRFSTKNDISEKPRRMVLNLLEGPFKKLRGEWVFTDLGEDGSKVEFFIEYTFANFLLENILGPVFKKITFSLVDAFRKRAEYLYEK